MAVASPEATALGGRSGALGGATVAGPAAVPGPTTVAATVQGPAAAAPARGGWGAYSGGSSGSAGAGPAGAMAASVRPASAAAAPAAAAPTAGGWGGHAGATAAPAAGPSAPSTPARPAGPLTVRDPEELNRAWLRLLAALPDVTRVTVHDVATPLAIEAGRLRVAVRTELWRGKVREHLSRLELGAILPGLGNVDVSVAAEEGKTGREELAEADVQRRADALTAARDSDAIKRLLAAFDAELEEVAPFVPDDALAVPVVVEGGDDFAPGGAIDG